MELLLVLLIPTVIIVSATYFFANKKLGFPNALHSISQDSGKFWNIMIGATIAIVAIKYALGK